MKTVTYGVVLLEKPLDDGISRVESNLLFDLLNGVSAIPFEVEAEYSSAMGWISLTDAERLNYDYKGLSDFVKEILEDMEKETPNHSYIYKNNTCGEISVFITR